MSRKGVMSSHFQHILSDWDCATRSFLKHRNLFIKPRYEIQAFMETNPDFLPNATSRFRTFALGMLFANTIPKYSDATYYNTLSYKYTNNSEVCKDGICKEES